MEDNEEDDSDDEEDGSDWEEASDEDEGDDKQEQTMSTNEDSEDDSEDKVAPTAVPIEQVGFSTSAEQPAKPVEDEYAYDSSDEEVWLYQISLSASLLNDYLASGLEKHCGKHSDELVQ